MKIGIIGLGNMGRSFAKAFVKGGYSVVAATRHPEKEKELNEFITLYNDNKKVAEEAEILFFAVKPYQLEEVMDEVRSSLGNPLIVSMAVGKSLDWIQETLGDFGILRIMPNTPVAVGKGVTVYTANEEVTDSQRMQFREIMQYTGEIKEIQETEMNVFSAVSGSLPAFVAMMIEGLSDGAVHEGMKRQDSYETIANTIIGTCTLLLEEGLQPGVLKDQVTSPGGTTIEGVRVLEEKGVRGAFMESIIGTVDKNKEIG